MFLMFKTETKKMFKGSKKQLKKITLSALLALAVTSISCSHRIWFWISMNGFNSDMRRGAVFMGDTKSN